MVRLELNKILLTAIAAASLAIIGGTVRAFFQGAKTQPLTLAAGSKTGESYLIGNALKTVVERHYPKIRIMLLETGGTVENLRMLDEGRAQLATAQADISPGPAARILTVLYDDAFQLLVYDKSPFHTFADLRGARMALPQSGGQFQSFLRVAAHFGLREVDFRFIGSTDEAAEDAFSRGQADAIFRVRALGNPSIEAMVRSGAMRFLPIEHAAAMKIQQPAFDPALIPQGAYLGNPPVPPQDLPTIAVHRTLLARDDANADAIRAITGVLIEERQEIVKEIPGSMTEVRLLLAQVRRPEAQAGLGPPLHPGATNFYDRDKPSFLKANADYIGLLVTLALMAASWIWELKRWVERQQKNAADLYSKRVITLMTSAKEVSSLTALEQIWRDLLAILAEAVRDLDSDKLSEESFESFRSILELAIDVTRDRRAILTAERRIAAIGA